MNRIHYIKILCIVIFQIAHLSVVYGSLIDTVNFVGFLSGGKFYIMVTHIFCDTVNLLTLRKIISEYLIANLIKKFIFSNEHYIGICP